MTVVIVNSITYAIKGQRLLEAHGIKAYLHRDMAAYGHYGCGYCLRIPRDSQQAVALLRENEIKIKAVLTEE